MSRTLRPRHRWGARQTRAHGACSRHMRRGRSHRLLAIVDLGLAADSSTAQTRVLVAIAPAIDGALDESALTAQRGVQFGKCPAHGVALSLVDKSVTAVLVFVAAGAWVDAVLRFEVLAESVHVDGLDVATDRVLHFHPVPRVLECNPLHSVAVLSHHERRSGRDRAWSGARARSQR